jgi:hypothetical protein
MLLAVHAEVKACSVRRWMEVVLAGLCAVRKVRTGGIVRGGYGMGWWCACIMVHAEGKACTICRRFMSYRTTQTLTDGSAGVCCLFVEDVFS